MQQPTMNELCGACRHKFSEHYVTFDGVKTGCTHYITVDMRDSGSGCVCTGFAIIFKPRTPLELANFHRDSMRNASPGEERHVDWPIR